MVTLLSIVPAFDTEMLTNGWMVNPSSMSENSYDGRLNEAGRRGVEGWTADLLPELPLHIEADSSVVKTISASAVGGTEASGHAPALATAVVLTVLDRIPPADAFRPPYYGKDKRIFTFSDVVQERLPSLGPPGGVTLPTLEWIAGRFARVQLDHQSSWVGRYMHPADNFRATPGQGEISNYGADMARDHNTAILRLMLNDKSFAEKKRALIAVLQAGIDWFGIANAGGSWPPDGGHFVGRKQVVVFAAVMFDDDEMEGVARDTAWSRFSENGDVYRGRDRALFGRPEDAEGAYWRQIEEGTGRRDLRDPLGQIDGGDNPGRSYQDLVSGTFSEAALISRLLPDGVRVWNNDAFFEYVDRWREFGAWTLPDTASSRRPNFGAHHGTRGSEPYRTAFLKAMWDTYR